MTATLPTLPSAPISIASITVAVTPAAFLSAGYSAATKRESLGARVTCGACSTDVSSALSCAKAGAASNEIASVKNEPSAS